MDLLENDKWLDETRGELGMEQWWGFTVAFI